MIGYLHYPLILNFINPVEERSGALLPEKAMLAQNYPNPFNSGTVINFSLPRASFVKLNVYDLLGRKVRTLVDGNYSAGNYTVDWNGRDDNGNSVATGVYLYRLDADKYTLSKKMVLLK